MPALCLTVPAGAHPSRLGATVAGAACRMLAGGGEQVAVALQYIVTPPTTQNLTHVWGQLLGRPFSDITARMGLRLDVNYVNSVSTVVCTRPPLPPPLAPRPSSRFAMCVCVPECRLTHDPAPPLVPRMFTARISVVDADETAAWV